MKTDYDDIIHLPHHQSTRHSHMSMYDRAAQFSPFAALTGFESAIVETGRLTDNRADLEEYGKAQLDYAMIQLQKLLPMQPEVTITCFTPDERKSGGAYDRIQGQIKKLDLYRQVMVLSDGREILLHDVVRIESEQFLEF